jgi:hypothetical protein
VEGTPFGRCQLIELLGRGGMGEVWRAHDTTIDRVVALKRLLPHYAQDPEFDRRFRREARAAARLDDPHVVPIYDVGEIDGRLYVTMRLIAGQDLQTMLNDGTEGPCPSGDLSSLTADAQYPMPAPPQNPISLLSGHGTWVQTGTCVVNLEFDETFTRTGD